MRTSRRRRRTSRRVRRNSAVWLPSGNVQALASVLRSLPGVRSVDVDSTGVEFEFEGTARDLESEASTLPPAQANIVRRAMLGSGWTGPDLERTLRARLDRNGRTSRRVRRNVKYYTPPWYKSAPAAIKHRRPSWLGGLQSGWKRGEGPGQRVYEFPNGRGASVIPYRAQRGWEQQGWELLPLSFEHDSGGRPDYSTPLTPRRGDIFIGNSADVNWALGQLKKMPAVVGPPSRRAYMHANAKRPRMSELGVFQAVGVVRAAHPREQLGLLPPGLAAQLKRVSPGLYRYGYGRKGAALTKFTKAGLRGAMTSTRIAASKSVEPHWLIDTSDPAYPVVIRAVTAQGKTVWRVEEYAKQFELVPVLAQRSRAASGGR